MLDYLKLFAVVELGNHLELLILAIKTHRKRTGKHKSKMDISLSDLIKRIKFAVVVLNELLQTIHFLDALGIFIEEVFKALAYDVQLDVAPT